MPRRLARTFDTVVGDVLAQSRAEVRRGTSALDPVESETAVTSAPGVVRGTALFVAAIVGPGILTLPAIAAAQAGPASLIPLGLLLLVSAPIAFTFVALSAARPEAAGVAGYAAAAFGPGAGRLVSAWFQYGVPIGVPALGLIGGQYAADAVGGGRAVTLGVATAICGAAFALTVLHRAGSGPFTLVLTAALILLIAAATISAVPRFDTGALTPFAPSGVPAVIASALVLTWVLTGWEAASNFTRVLRDPRRTLPRATTATLVIVAGLYAAVALSEILVLGPRAGDGEAPLGAMLSITIGPAGAAAAAVIAVTIAFGNSLAYVGSLAEGGAPAGGGARTPRRGRARALLVPAAISAAGLAAAAFTPIGTEQLISVCAGSQVPVYILGLAAGVRLLPRLTRSWWAATIATASVSLLLVPAGPYLVTPALIAVVLLVVRRVRRPRQG